jgi:hypothetical protein
VSNAFRMEYLGSREVVAALDRIRRHGKPAVAEALNRTGFEVLDQLDREVGRSFRFAGPTTERFLRRGFQFDKATPEALVIQAYPRRAARRLFTTQALGGSFTHREVDRLDLGAKIAVPVGEMRRRIGPGGRVPERLAPLRLVSSGKAFINAARTAIFLRTAALAPDDIFPSGMPGGLELAYVLVDRIRLRPRFDFFGAFTKAAATEFPRRVDRVIEKINRSGGR